MERHIIISVRGGLVTHVCSNDPKIEVTILDHDNFEQGDEPSDHQRAAMKKVEKSKTRGTKIDNKTYTTL